MNKFFAIFSTAIAAIIISGCGASKQITNDPYAAEGTGIAIREDIAYNKAFLSACEKLAQKHNFVVDYATHQNYESEDFANRKGNERLYNAQKTTGESHIEASDIVVTKYKYSKAKGGKIECWVSVKVSPDNLR